MSALADALLVVAVALAGFGAGVIVEQLARRGTRRRWRR
jgi:hypothetical protein